MRKFALLLAAALIISAPVVVTVSTTPTQGAKKGRGDRGKSELLRQRWPSRIRLQQIQTPRSCGRLVTCFRAATGAIRQIARAERAEECRSSKVAVRRRVAVEAVLGGAVLRIGACPGTPCT